MATKNIALLRQEDKKQKSLNEIALVAEQERRQKGCRPGDFIVYSNIVWGLAKYCRDCGCSCKEISQAAKVTSRAVFNWVQKTVAPQIRELNIVPNKIIDIPTPLLSNSFINVKKEVTEKCELIFPSGAKLVMDGNFFINNIVELLFTPKE